MYFVTHTEYFREKYTSQFLYNMQNALFLRTFVSQKINFFNYRRISAPQYKNIIKQRCNNNEKFY